MNQITPEDMGVLALIARYYVLTRAQLERLEPSEDTSSRGMRRRLGRLRKAGFLQQHRIPVLLPETNGAAPVYYPTRPGAEALCAFFDDEAFLTTNTRHPRGDRLAHWIAINDTRMTLERAIARQNHVALDRWVSEWHTVNVDAAEQDRFVLHTQLSTEPPLSCSPDAAFVLRVGNIAKVYYVERDLGTSSPKQIAARKTKGYAALAERAHHRVHFPQATAGMFSVLVVTTNAYRVREIGRQLRKRPWANLWLLANAREVTAETFLHAPITYDVKGVAGPLVKPPGDAKGNSQEERSS